MQLCTYYYNNLPNANLRIYTNANQTLPLGANYSQNYISNDSIYTCIQWTPSSSDTGIYFYTLCLKTQHVKEQNLLSHKIISRF
ncbi:MAG: hypothetical protein R2831_10300 [Chitinophagaceae bacterium]